jgi:ribosomal protein S18 acetylase RimI-like enzyme
MASDRPLPSPPDLPGLTWRPARREDAPALRRLYLACDEAAGGNNARFVTGYETDFDSSDTNPATDTLVAVDTNGDLAALAWVSTSRAIKHQYRAQLEGAVHPHARGRGIGDFLLDWMEARARQIFAMFPRDRELVLRIDFMGTRDDAVPLYERHGFVFNHAADIMRRDLRAPIPDRPLPPSMAFVGYAPELAGAAYAVYADAFYERTAGSPASESTWTSAFLGYSHFRPDCSLLVMDGEVAAAYAVCGVEPAEHDPAQAEGWVNQIGVRAAYRRRGIATALLCEVMRRFRAEGLRFAALDVNVNNPTAKLAYEKIGFATVKRLTVYRKVIAL